MALVRYRQERLNPPTRFMETTATTREASSRLHSAIEALRAISLPPDGEIKRNSALEAAEIVRALDADDDVVIAAMIQPLIDAGYLEREGAAKRFGDESVRLARALSQLGQFGLPTDWTPERGLESAQAEALRKMLLAVIGDVRLVVVRLAEQLQKMRSAKDVAAARQRKLAIETREVYAPLANRLGVWRVKWELEDLAFRYLEPLQYKHIATALKTRRSERERYIDELKSVLQDSHAQCRHRRRHRSPPQTHLQHMAQDAAKAAGIRAAHGHTGGARSGEQHRRLLRGPGSRAFSLALYPRGSSTTTSRRQRTICTAPFIPPCRVPGGEPVEIQIRTDEMHAESERGLAAHWKYKEGGRANQAYERKINELRSLLAPAEGPAAAIFSIACA